MYWLTQCHIWYVSELITSFIYKCMSINRVYLAAGTWLSTFTAWLSALVYPYSPLSISKELEQIFNKKLIKDLTHNKAYSLSIKIYIYILFASGYDKPPKSVPKSTIFFPTDVCGNSDTVYGNSRLTFFLVGGESAKIIPADFFTHQFCVLKK